MMQKRTILDDDQSSSNSSESDKVSSVSQASHASNGTSDTTSKKWNRNLTANAFLTTMNSMMKKMNHNENQVVASDGEEGDFHRQSTYGYNSESRTNFNDHARLRDHRIAHFIHYKILATQYYRYVSITAVIIALFLFDFSRAVLHPSTDIIVEIIIATVFVLLMFDVIFQSIAYINYLKSAFFVLDLVGTLTIVADLNLTYGILGTSKASLLAARGHRAGRVARSAATLRLTKIVVWAKIARLVRLARLYTIVPKKRWSNLAWNSTHKDVHPDPEFDKSVSYLAQSEHYIDDPNFLLDNVVHEAENEESQDEDIDQDDIDRSCMINIQAAANSKDNNMCLYTKITIHLAYNLL